LADWWYLFLLDRAENVRCRREEIDVCCPPGKLVVSQMFTSQYIIIRLIIQVLLSDLNVFQLQDLKFVLVEAAWKMNCQGQAIWGLMQRSG
jgi:hypothetical protein